MNSERLPLGDTPASTPVVDRRLSRDAPNGRSLEHRSIVRAEMTDEEDLSVDLQTVLDAIDDPDCRTILRTLDAPMTAQELVDECDISQTTAYRKLDRLSEASLVDERTRLRDDGHHATQYVRAFSGIYINLDDEGFEVGLEPPTDVETPDERLARFWSEVSEEL